MISIYIISCFLLQHNLIVISVSSSPVSTRFEDRQTQDTFSCHLFISESSDRMKAVIVLLIPLLLPLVSAQTVRWGPCPTPMVQPNFELNKYLGKWYEIEKLPAAFERGKCIEANYALRPDNTVQVLNIQTHKGKIRKAEGTAVVQDMRETAKLGVSFSYFTPYAPYWILSTDYNSIALVYSCTDVLRMFHVDYAWILSRSRILPAEAVYHAKEIFSRDNIDVSKMTATDQLGCDGPI